MVVDRTRKIKPRSVPDATDRCADLRLACRLIDAFPELLSAYTLPEIVERAADLSARESALEREAGR
jgi:hypothetical protein